jgi:hypothetical protein
VLSKSPFRDHVGARIAGMSGFDAVVRVARLALQSSAEDPASSDSISSQL